MASPEIFNLEAYRSSVFWLFFIPALINFSIYLFINLKFSKSKINFFFSLFVLCLAAWQTSEGLVKMSRTAGGAREWHKVSEILILFVIPCGLNFLICLTKEKRLKKSRIFSILLYLPIVVFIVFIQSGSIKYDIVRSEIWYWIENPVPGLMLNAIFTWISLGGLLMFILLVNSYFRAKNAYPRNKQLLLLLTGIAFPVFGGIVAEVIVPLVLGLNDVPVTSVLVTVFSVFSFVAITKYRMLDYSPKHQWGEIVNEMAEGILIVNNEDEIMYANRAFCNTVGYELNELKGKIAKQLFISEEDYPVMEAGLSHKNGNQPCRFEVQVKTKHGEKIWLKISSSPYKDSKGNIIGSIGLQTNITKHKKDEEYLRHSEFRLKQAQSVACIGSWELDFQTGKAIWSEEACRIYGLPLSERYSQTFSSWLSFIHPEDKIKVIAETERSRSNLINSSFKHRIIRSDGSIKHIHTVAHLDFNSQGFPVGVHGVCHDITDQVEAEYSLRESEDNMRAFIDGSLLSIYFVDPLTKRILYSNPALSELLGYSPEEFKRISPYDFINHSVEDVNQRIKEVMENKRLNNGERQWKRKDGSIVNVLVSSFYHKRNGTDAIYVAAQDITERKKAEEKLESTNRELELFIYKASHDIRGPLTSVMGLINVSKLEIQDEKSLRYLEMIDTATKKLDYILGELMKAMKIKDVSIFNEAIDFEDLTDDILKAFHHFPGFGKLNIIKSVSIAGTFYSNRSIIETILQNLVENAIKYQKSHGSSPYLKIEVTGNEEKVKIRVEDNGIGIEETFHSQIFNMYFKANNHSAGSGLGLYLVKKAVDKLGAEMMLKSRQDEGTQFEIVVPAQKKS